MNAQNGYALVRSHNEVYDAGTLAWVSMTQPGGSTGGGGDASAANQLTGNASLASIDSKLATPLPISNANLDAALSSIATQATAALIKAKTDNLDAALSTRLSESDFDTKVGSLTETAPLTDIASSGMNGRLQRIAQRLSSLIGLLPTALTGNNALRVEQIVAGPTQPVSGTFWQATQPVSGTVTSNAGTNLNTSALNLETTQTAMSAKLPATLGQKTMAASMAVAIASDQGAVPTSAPTLTKGTQGATGFSVQELKDAGRVNIAWTATITPAATAETLATITESRDGAATTTFTTKVITSGKRLRVTSVSFQVENSLGTSIQRAYVRMRVNTAGAVTTGSPLQGVWAGQALGTVKSVSPPILEEFPDGFEILGDGTKQIGFTVQAPDWVTASATLNVYVTIFGFEY